MDDKANWTPPDGGWGWVIVICSLLFHVQGIGVLLSMGVMYVDWLDTFGEGRSTTSWVVSVGVAVSFGLSPLPAALANKYGFRVVTIMGGLLISTGYILSYFATSIAFLVVSVGFITGLGCCFVFLSSLAVVSVYFSKRRSVALGIATSGTGVGVLISAPILDFLIDTYGWRGTLLIAGAASLNICAYAMLLRPLDIKTVTDDSFPVQSNDGAISTDENMKRHQTYSITNDTITESENNIIIGIDEKSIIREFQQTTSVDEKIGKYPSIILSDASNDAHPDSALPYDRLTNAENKLKYNNLISKTTSLTKLQSGTKTRNKPFSSLVNITKNNPYSLSDRMLPYNKNKRSKLSLDVMFARSIKHLEAISILGILPTDELQRFESITIDNYQPKEESLICDNELQSQVSMQSFTTERNGCLRSCNKSICDVIQKNVNMLRHPIFLRYVLSNTVTNLSFITPVMYLVDRAIDSGMDKSTGAILTSMYGVGNIMGRILFGAVTYRLFPDRLLTLFVVVAWAGIVTLLSPLCGSSVALHGISTVLIGSFLGGYATLCAVVSVDLMGLDKATDSIGLLLTFQGIATLLGPPFAGLLFDYTNSYTMTYIIYGFVLLLSAVIILPDTIMRRRRLQREETERRNNKELHLISDESSNILDN